MVEVNEIPTRCPKCGCEDLVEVTRHSPDHHTWMCRKCYIDIDVPAEVVKKHQDVEPPGEAPGGRSGPGSMIPPWSSPRTTGRAEGICPEERGCGKMKRRDE